uniref:Uncharacterized protein n=1 Tax=Strongyloides papillosus TaxID=174720 RepID=A0A0N5C0W8_STREA
MFLRIFTVFIINLISTILISSNPNCPFIWEDFYVSVVGQVNWATEGVKKAGGTAKLICNGREVTRSSLKNGELFRVETQSHTSHLPNFYVSVVGQVNWATEGVKKAGGTAKLICNGREVTRSSLKNGELFRVETQSHTSHLPSK